MSHIDLLGEVRQAAHGELDAFSKVPTLGQLQYTLPRYVLGLGTWNGRQIKEMTTSHLKNTILFLTRSRDREEDKNPDSVDVIREGFNIKIEELEAELATRKPVAIKRTIVQITPEMLLKLASQMGIKIPKSGAGIYLRRQRSEGEVLADGTIRHLFGDSELTIEFDEEKPLNF